MDDDLLCQLCNVEVSNREELKNHLLGEQHQLKLNPNKEENENVLEEDESIMCTLCNLKIIYKHDWERHQKGKRHMSNVDFANREEEKEKYSVYVGDLPNLVPQQEILDFFKTYGTIKTHHFGAENYYVIIQFDEPSVVSKLLQSVVVFKGKKLNIKPRLKKDTNQQSRDKIENNQTEDYDEINNIVKNCSDFDSQVFALFNCCRPNWNEVLPKYNEICRDLQLALQEVFQNCIVHPFGSTVTGLGFHSSDVDIFVQVFNTNTNSSSEDSASKYVTISRKLLQKYNRIFSHVIAIPKAKTPICKFFHNSTQIRCDFNFKNMLGVCNSRLISYYLSLDVRLTHLMIVLKYWGKVHNLTGSSGKFSNYSLFMLFLSYLQQIYLFPPVIALQTNESTNLQENWNGGFDSTIKFVSPSLAQASVVDILKGFFDYYSKFDYSLYVICPYMGHPVPKINFLELHLLDPAFVLYRANIEHKLPLRVESAVCIQDPYEHTHNLSSSVPQKHLNDFTIMCEIGYNAIANKSSLHDLFTVKPTPLPVSKEINIESFNFSLVFNNAYSLYLSKLINCNSLNITDRQASIQSEWYGMAQRFVLNFMTKIMKFTVSIEDTTTEHKMRRIDGQSDVHDKNLIESVMLTCKGSYNMWGTRKALAKYLTPQQESLPVLEKQIAISDIIMNVAYKNEVLTESLVVFNLEINAVLKPTKMQFRVIKISSKKKCFKVMAFFLQKNLPHLFDLHMKELSKGTFAKHKEINSEKLVQN